MKVSVIIPFRAKNAKVLKCIESVKNQNYKDIEIITVSDRAKLKIKGIKSLVNEKCRGVGVKRNFGAREASGDVLFFLDSDCVVKQDSITKLVKMFETGKIQAISGKTLAPQKGNILDFVTGLEYEDRFNRMDESYVNVAATTCLGVLKKTFQDVGGFKDYSQTEATGEDWDFSVRLVQKNYKLYHTNKVEVFHEHVSKNFMDYLKRQFLHVKYRVTHLRRYKQLTDEYSSLRMILSTTLLFCLPSTYRMYHKTKNLNVLMLPIISFFRNIAWLAGFVAGLFE
jgi:glycosyltransferase involved in cell wall biosynthesis